MEITINGNVTINGGIEDARDTQAAQNETAKQETPAVNHDEDVLLDNSTSFFGLLDFLRTCPDAVNAEKDEAERKRQAAEQEKLKKVLGDDYADYVEQTEANSRDDFKKEKRRPGAIQLWNNYHRIASKEIGEDGKLDVYTNGYAVYDNGNRRTVIWVPDCGSVTYYFTPLRDNEKQYLKQKDELGEDLFGPLPWFHALMVAGEDSIERNLEHPKSVGTTSEALEDEDYDVKPDYMWRGSAHIETPEEYVMRLERERERREALTEKQREVYEMYFNQGYTQQQIADILGIAQQSVQDRINLILKKLGNIEKYFF